MSPSGKGSPGKGGKAGGKGGGKSAKGSARGSAAPRRSTVPAAQGGGRGGGAGRAPVAVKAAPGRPPRPSEPPRLRVLYNRELHSNLQRQLELPNPMLVPRMEKIVLNMGVGRAVAQPSLLEGAVRDLTIISGQRPVVTKARKSIAAFKLREGNAIGAKVTLRGDRMWEFFDRLISLAIPRIRDFRGLSPKGFDGRGNYTFGVNEQLIFPEIDYDKIDAPRGMDLTIVTTARTDGEGMALLDAFGFPFRKEGAA
jgi:large subunit ribosomal protein L5